MGSESEALRNLAEKQLILKDAEGLLKMARESHKKAKVAVEIAELAVRAQQSREARLAAWHQSPGCPVVWKKAPDEPTKLIAVEGGCFIISRFGEPNLAISIQQGQYYSPSLRYYVFRLDATETMKNWRKFCAERAASV